MGKQKKYFSPVKVASLVFSISILCFAVVSLSFAAWNTPGTGYPAGTDCTPPNCNAPAPVNVGDVAQAKTGELWVNTNYVYTNGFMVPYGNVGFGLEKTNPTSIFQVAQPTVGPGTVTNTATTVTGTNTQFTNTFKVGDTIMSGPEVEIKIGNALPISAILD